MSVQDRPQPLASLRWLDVTDPWRLFFPLGVLLGWAGALHWVLYATGVTSALPRGLPCDGEGPGIPDLDRRGGGDELAHRPLVLAVLSCHRRRPDLRDPARQREERPDALVAVEQEVHGWRR